MAREACDTANRFVHTDDGWQEWCTHVDDCDECKRDLEYFYNNLGDPK